LITIISICFFIINTYVYGDRGTNNVMPWMCLERCQENITADLNQIKQHLSSFTAISFEDYDLGLNGTLISNNFTSVNYEIQKLGFQAYPMITTANLTKLRQLFETCDTFIFEAIQRANQYQYTGYNIDFEPTDEANEEDAAEYAIFLTKFADALHDNGKFLSVDIASWNTFWNFELLGSTTVDKIITMDTYAENITYFQYGLEKALTYIGIDHLGIGLDCEGTNLSDEELQERFDLITQYNVKEIDIWDMPIPDNWWQFLNSFIKQ